MAKRDIEDRIKRLEEELKSAKNNRRKAKTTQKRKETKIQNKKDILYAIYRRNFHADEYKKDISSSEFDNFLTRDYDRAFFGLPPLTIKLTETQPVQSNDDTEELSQTDVNENEQAKVEPMRETSTSTEIDNQSSETETEEQHTTAESNHSLLIKTDEPETPATVDLPWKMVEGQMRLYIKSEYKDRDKIIRTAKSVFGEESRGTHFNFDKVRKQWYFIKTETDYDLTPFSDWPPADADDE